MEIGFMVQTSSRATETEYEKEKNAIADIVGNLNLGVDMVQVGFMYYSKRLRNTLSLLKKDQNKKKRQFYVDKAKELPYMPFLNTPFVETLRLTTKNMLNIQSSDDDYIKPKVAVLFNDNQSNEDLNLIRQAANELKSKNVQVYTIGIGNSYDIQQLKTIASDENNFISVKNHESIYESISDILENVCTSYALMSFDKKESVNIGENDYRYFKINFPSLTYPFIEIELNELEGYTRVFYSFTNRNPTQENSQSIYKQSKRYNNSKSAIKVLFFEAPSMNLKSLYITVVGTEKVNKAQIKVRNVEF
jgi:hypothetical protein